MDEVILRFVNVVIVRSRQYRRIKENKLSLHTVDITLV